MSGNGNDSVRRPAKRRKQLELHELNCEDIKTQLKAHGVSIEENEDKEEKEQIVNTVPEYGKYADKTALEVAVNLDNPKTVDCLLHLGADPNIRFDENTNTPLYTAIEKNRVGIVRLLLEKGANVNDTKKIDENYISPLFLAAVNGYHEIIDELLKKNPNLDEAVSSTTDMQPNITPLVVAALEGHTESVKLLKRAGSIPPNFTQNDFQDFLLAAVHTKLLNRAKMLLDNFEYIREALNYSGEAPSVNHHLSGEYSVLYNALSVRGNGDVVEYLYDREEEPEFDPVPYKGQTEFQNLDKERIEEYSYYLMSIETNNESYAQNESPPRRAHTPMRVNGPTQISRGHVPLLMSRILPTREQRMLPRSLHHRARKAKTRKARKGKARKARKLTRRG